jgi:long-chain acyl-CoA synthetase
MVVEDAIRKTGAVSACSVVGRKRKGSDYYEAVAFVVKQNPAQEDAQLIGQLAASCAERVPTYMIPAEYRFVTELPHTPVGKVDFRALEKEAETERN